MNSSMKRYPILHSETVALSEYFVQVSWSEMSALHCVGGSILVVWLVGGLGVGVFAELDGGRKDGRQKMQGVERPVGCQSGGAGCFPEMRSPQATAEIVSRVIEEAVS